MKTKLTKACMTRVIGVKQYVTGKRIETGLSIRCGRNYKNQSEYSQ